MPGISTRSLSTKARVFLVALEVIILLAIVAALFLRHDHYFKLGGPRPHVVIFLVDALRADHLGCYGHPVHTSPFIDRLAGKGVVFESCRSQAPWTMPSVASLLTSLYPSAHKAVAFPSAQQAKTGRDTGLYDILPEQVMTLAEVFKDNGYRTACFSTNRWIDPVFGFHQGFDDFFALAKSMPPGPDGKPVIVLNLPADYLHEKLLNYLLETAPEEWERWLERIGIYQKPLFLYLHYMDVHGPYRPPAPFTDMFDDFYSALPDRELSQQDIDRMDYLYQDNDSLNFYLSRYDAQIRFLDREMEGMINLLDDKDLLSPSLMLFVSDHGESFGEHGVFDHGNTLYEEEIHVPLIMWGTASFPPGTRVSEPAQVIDIGPTLLDALGIRCPGQFEGKSLLAAIRGDIEPGRISWSEKYSHGRPQIIMIENRNKWFYDVAAEKISETFDLNNDREEKSNLVDSIPPETIIEKERIIKAWIMEEAAKIEIEGEVPAAQVSDDIRRQLEALGYAGDKK